ncbi:MAG: alpha/beta fold hydrolase, partial [Acidimicrobiales bacterium]
MDSLAPTAPAAPVLPPGRRVELPGRGTTFVRELAGPPGAPTVVLLHGWTVTADLNWFPSYEALGRHFSVLALDHRGHGQGLRSRRPFRLEDCADDVAAAVEATGNADRRLVLVGYSMGGPVAALTWRRHPGLAAGLVLCATAARFSVDLGDWIFYSGMFGLSLASRLTPELVRRPFTTSFIRRRTSGLGGWAAEQVAASSTTAVLEAGSALGGFDGRSWLGRIDVPTAVVVTTEDTMVSPDRQQALAGRIPGATVHPVQGDHVVCVTGAERFV